jgi:hypothetical protein
MKDQGALIIADDNVLSQGIQYRASHRLCRPWRGSKGMGDGDDRNATDMPALRGPRVPPSHRRTVAPSHRRQDDLSVAPRGAPNRDQMAKFISHFGRVLTYPDPDVTGTCKG